MNDLKKLSDDELTAQMLGVVKGYIVSLTSVVSEDASDDEFAKKMIGIINGHVSDLSEVVSEVTRRLKLVDAAINEDREKNVNSFAHSATTAVTGLWMSHKGRQLTNPELHAFAKLMFEFFLTIR
jgi:hypothetical protein